MSKRVFPIVAVLVLTGMFTLIWVTRRQSARSTQPTHIHAGFLVYVDGKKQDFSDSRYMNLEFCGKSSGPETPESIQKEKAHLHDGVGDVVHVHQSGAMWKDLFRNMGYSFPSGKSIVAYVDGVKSPDILDIPIKPYSSAVFIIGESTSTEALARIPREHILEVEKKSESCGDP